MKNPATLPGALLLMGLSIPSLNAGTVQYQLTGLTYDDISVTGTVSIDSVTNMVTDLDVVVPASVDITPATLSAEFVFAGEDYNGVNQFNGVSETDNYQLQLNFFPDGSGGESILQALFYGGPADATVTGNNDINGNPENYYTLQGTGELVTPEPASAALLFLGLAGLAASKLRKK